MFLPERELDIPSRRHLTRALYLSRGGRWPTKVDSNIRDGAMLALFLTRLAEFRVIPIKIRHVRAISNALPQPIE